MGAKGNREQKKTAPDSSAKEATDSQDQIWWFGGGGDGEANRNEGTLSAFSAKHEGKEGRMGTETGKLTYLKVMTFF